MTLSKNNFQKLDTAQRLVFDACSVGYHGYMEVPDGAHGDEAFVMLTMAERFISHLEGIKALLEPYRHDRRIDTSIGLVVRVCLLDFITLTYLISYAYDDQDARGKGQAANQMVKHVEIFLCDQIFNSLKYLRISRKANLIPEDDYKKAVEATYENYQKFFKDDIVDYTTPESKVLHQKFPKVQDMFHRINSHGLVKGFAKVYDLYTYYSKYEHLGVMSPVLQRIDVNEQFLTMLYSIEYSVKGLKVAMAFAAAINHVLDKDVERLGEIEREFELLTNS